MPENRNFDMRTVLDVGLFVGMIISACFSIFVFFAMAQGNAQAIEGIKEDIQEVKEVHQRDKEGTYKEMKDQRKEAKEQYEKVDKKLDKVIDHLMNNNGNGRN